MPEPSVSVLLAAHNEERHLPEALDTLLAQTFDDFELVAVDDASTDRTPEVLAEYAARDGRVRVVRNEENRRLAGSLNRGLGLCRAGLVARADADDTYHPERLARQVAFMRANPDVGLLSTACWKVYESGRRDLLVHPTDDAEIRVRDLFVNSFLHPGVMYRADLVRSVGGYDEAFWTAQDVDLWARLLPLTRVANLADPLVTYRVHSAQTTKTRGEAGHGLGLSVRQRVLSAYLGRDVSLDETRAAVRLYKGNRPLTGEHTRVGLGVLREVGREVRRREPAQAARFHRRAVGEALVRQAIRQRAAEPALALRLLAHAFAESPRTLLSPDVAGAVRARAGRLRLAWAS